MDDGTSHAPLVVREIQPGTPDYEAAADVRYEALYEPWGVPRSAVADTNAGAFLHVAAFAGDRLVGYGRILLGGGDAHVYQVAVAEDRRRRGAGRAVVRALVEVARREGRSEVVLNARDYAIGFYERLGFVAEGDWFPSGATGLPHKVMRIRLS